MRNAAPIPPPPGDPISETTEEAPEQFCGSCVHRERIYRRANMVEEDAAQCTCVDRGHQAENERRGNHIISGWVQKKDLMSGPHACEHWHPSDAHRLALAAEAQAESLAGIDLAAAILSGLWVEPAGDEAPADIFGCSCGLPLSPSRDETEMECPNCHLVYIGDGSGKWIEAE